MDAEITNKAAMMGIKPSNVIYTRSGQMDGEGSGLSWGEGRGQFDKR